MSAEAPRTIADEYGIRLCHLLELLAGRATLDERMSTLIDYRTIGIVANQPVAFEPGGQFASFAVVNPNNFPVYIGLGESDGVAGKETVSIPAAAWIVLPAKGRRISVGGGNNAGQVHVLAFLTAQQFGAGALGASWAP